MEELKDFITSKPPIQKCSPIQEVLQAEGKIPITKQGLLRGTWIFLLIYTDFHFFNFQVWNCNTAIEITEVTLNIHLVKKFHSLFFSDMITIINT